MDPSLLVDALEEPSRRSGGEEGEAEEGVVGELEVPLDALPALFGVPPGAGEREGAVGGDDASAVGAGEEGEREVMAAAEFGGDVDFERGAEAFQREGR